MSSFRNTVGLKALIVGAAFTLPCRIAAATEAPEAQGVGASADEHEAYPLSAGLRAFTAPGLGIAGFGAGLDLAYSIRPELAVGAQYFVFAVDQGADPDYCERCIRSGSAGVVAAEGRLWFDSFVTPYARAGFGLAHLAGQRVAYERDYTENGAALHGELGLDLHYRWVSLRLFGFHLAVLGSDLDSDPFNAVGAQLGGRF